MAQHLAAKRVVKTAASMVCWTVGCWVLQMVDLLVVLDSMWVDSLAPLLAE